MSNSLKILQDGTIFLQPPILNENANQGEFVEQVCLGNVNKEVLIPKEYQLTTYKTFEIIGENCSSACPEYNLCKQNISERKIYINKFSCIRLSHFRRMANYAKGGSMTDQQYNDILENTCLTNAVINVTDNCNLRCPYCFTEHNPRIIDLGTMKAAIMFMANNFEKYPENKKKNKGLSFNFFGGEPMLHFEDIIKPTILWTEEMGLREKYKIDFGMTTNGTMLNENTLPWLKEHKVSILLSMDGDKETQDSQRPGVNGSSSFDMIAPNIPTILKYYPSVTFRSAIQPFNVDKMFENYLFARKNNFLNYFITPNVDTDWSLEDTRIAMEQLSLIAQVFYQDITNNVIPLAWNELITNIREHFYKDFKHNNTISFNHCGIGTNSIGIAVDGSLIGCQEHNTYQEHDIFYIGNIFTGIDKTRHKRLLEEYSKKDHPVCKEEPDRCNTCDFYDYCSSHYCPSHNFNNNSSAIENKRISCIWKEFVSNLGLVLLEQAEAEKNINFLNYIQNCITSELNKNFSIW